MIDLSNNNYSIYPMYRLLIITLWWPALSHAIELDDYDWQHDQITYISPTRLKQSPHDVPASVSRITQETIGKLQLNSLPEVFNYIVGMAGIRVVGYGYSVNYHVSDINAPGRMLLLIDGIAIYRPFYTVNSWSSLPLTINDIDYIEVTRSPGAATYGINALMAVINIVTKDPLNSPAFSASATKSGNDYERLDMSFSGKPSARFSYRISASASDDTGFDREYEDGESLEDGYTISLINSKVNFKIDPSTQASLSFYYGNSDREDEADTTGNVQFNANEDKFNTKSRYFSGSVNRVISAHHDIAIKAYHARVKESFNPILCDFPVFFSEPLYQLSLLNFDYAAALLAEEIDEVPFSGSPEEDNLREQFAAEEDEYADILYETSTCGNASFNSVEKNTAVEFEDTYIFNENLRLVSGLGATRQHIDSMTYFQGEVSSTTYRAFANAETRWQPWVFNTGAMLEYNDKAPDKTAFSPRIGANYRLNNHSTLKFILSKAVQIPDLSEREFNRGLYVENLTQPYPADGRTAGYLLFSAFKPNDEIESEEILAREISLYTEKRYPSDHGTVDVSSDIKLFYNSLSFRPYLLYGNVESTSNMTLKGFETDINFLFSNLSGDALESLDFRINYTYLDSNTGNFLENSGLTAEEQAFTEDVQFIKHTGSMYAIFNLNDGWFSALSYSGNLTKAETYNTYEFGFGRKIKLALGAFTLSGKLSHQNRPNDGAVNDSPNAFFFNAKLSL